MATNDLVFFHAGDRVQLKQDIPNKPVMVVSSIPKTRRIGQKDLTDKPILLGVKCFWFTSDGSYQERLFNSKDLEII